MRNNQKSGIFDVLRNRGFQRAQSGMNAAILIAIISALIIIYIVFLPSDERNDLIGENVSEHDDDNGGKGILLIDEKDMIMQYIDNDEIEHDLPSVNLFTSTAATAFREEPSLYVKNGIFDKEQKVIQFSVKEADNTKNILISFDVKKGKGNLILSLNNHEILNREVSSGNVEPLKIPKEYLSSSNELKFEVSGVGVAFWSTNEYLIENIRITGDVTDTTRTQAELSFIIPDSESDNIEKAKLRFVPECQPNNVGVLEISINEHEIFSSVPDCGTPRPLEFSSAHLITGENTLAFKTDRGRYLIDQVRVTTRLKETPSFTFFFDIDEDDYEDIKDENKVANLTFFFTDDEEDKEAVIYVNSRKISMTRHDDITWSANLKSYVEEGSNSLKIVPETKLEVRKLQLRLHD